MIAWMAASAKPKEATKPQEKEEDENDPPDFPKTCLRWLPQPKTGKRKATFQLDKGWFDILRDLPDNEFHTWSLMEISLPPLLAKKYHVVKVSELMIDGADRLYMGVATWFVLWSQAFGMQYLNAVHCKELERRKLEEQRKGVVSGFKTTQVLKEQKQWRDNANEILTYMGLVSKVQSAPTLKDCASKASEFLLEPCIIIQLPWNTVLLHQWLAAALVEVLIFEKTSSELRHWPLPQEVEECAADLLTLVKDLKERIVLGFAILSQQVTFYPQVEAKHPGWILDEVVLPSLATLQFLISGKAFTVLKSIKKIAWSKHEHIDGRVYMPVSAYCMDNFLDDIYLKCCYNFPFLNVISDTAFPAPINFLGEVEIESVIERITNNKTVVSINKSKHNVPFDRKDITTEEEMICNLVNENQRNSQYAKSAEEISHLTLLTVREQLVQTGRIPDIVWDKVTFIFNSEAAKNNTPTLFLFEDGFSDYDSIVLYSIMYCYLNSILVDKEKENSVMARIISLGLESLEREQIIKVANITCSILNISPIAVNLDKSTPLSIKSISCTIQEVFDKRECQKQSWLWRQFAAEWRQPVSLVEPALQLGLGTAAIVKACEDRIGRIVFNSAQACFDVYENGGDSFPYWQTVQYILPCYLASFVDFLNTPGEHFSKTINFLSFLHEVLKFYENNFHQWLLRHKARQLVDVNQLEMKPTLEKIGEIVNLSTYYKDQNYLLQVCYVGILPENTPCEGFPGFNHVINSLVCAPGIFYIEFERSCVVHVNCKMWAEKTFQFLRDLHKISILAWNPIEPGSQIAQKKLGEIYFADCVLEFLDVLHQSTFIYVPDDHTASGHVESALACKASLKQTIQWRYDLFNTVKNINKLDISKHTLPKEFEEERTKMIKFYSTLKIVKQWMGSTIRPKFVLKNIPSSPSVLKQVTKYYMDGNFSALDKMLLALTTEDEKPIRAQPSTSSSGTLPKRKGKTSETLSKSKPQATPPYQQCRNCPKTERKWGLFVVCEQCVTDKYPDVNYFCSKACKEARWKEEHFAEHLEFDLGLADFSHLNP